ncbi:ATPase family associated with various cellular activities-domain-containing protein [Xylaria sp. FL0933]|nr:ATPase family associated with various cellular activities-domain-containing protein [Xylaria sp. FL0933]
MLSSVEAQPQSSGVVITDLPSWFLKGCVRASGELAGSDPILRVEKSKALCHEERETIFEDSDCTYDIDVDFYSFARDEVAATSIFHKALFFRAPTRQESSGVCRGFLASLVDSIARDFEADLVTLDRADMANLAEHYARREKRQDWAQKDGIWPDPLLGQYDAEIYDEFEFDTDPLDSIPIPFKTIVTAASYKTCTRLVYSPRRIIVHIPEALSFTDGDDESLATLPEPCGPNESSLISPEETVELTELGGISDVIYVVPTESGSLKSLMDADSRSQQCRFYVDRLQKVTRRLRTLQRGPEEEQEENAMLLPYSRLGAVLSSELRDSMTGEPSFYLAQSLAEIEDWTSHRAIRNAAREARQIDDVLRFQYLKDSDNANKKEQDKRQILDQRHTAIKKANNWDGWEGQVADLIVDVANLRESWKGIDIDTESKKSIIQMANICHSSGAGSSGILRNASAKGAILYGPPGTGKTHLARVLAKESRSVMIHVSAAEALQKYVGESEDFVNALFSVGRKVAPSIIFIDEADAFLRTRTADDKPWTGSMISQFLQESDGLQRMKNPTFLAIGYQ